MEVEEEGCYKFYSYIYFNSKAILTYTPFTGTCVILLNHVKIILKETAISSQMPNMLEQESLCLVVILI